VVLEAKVEQVQQLMQLVLLEQMHLDMEMAAAVVAAAAQHQELEEQVEAEALEQFSFTGNLPDPKELKYKMYAVVKNGIVKNYVWEKTEEDAEFVLMTFENSPAWIDGEYKNGKFYQPKEKRE
jgi:hypothetical protein